MENQKIDTKSTVTLKGAKDSKKIILLIILKILLINNGLRIFNQCEYIIDYYVKKEIYYYFFYL